MVKNNCLEHLRAYKLEHQTWFNDIHNRLNLLLVERKKVKFESLEKVASKWIIPVSSDLKSLQGITEIQKLILIEVQAYKKIIELINKPLKGSFFESKNKTIQKRDHAFIMHAEAMSTAYSNIVEAFNNLEKDIITKKVQCKLTVVSSTKTELKSNKTTTVKKDIFKKQKKTIKEEDAIKPIATSLTKETKLSSVSNSTKTEQKISNKQTDITKKDMVETSIQKAIPTKLNDENTLANTSKITPKTDSNDFSKETAIPDNTNTLSMENMLNQNLLNTLNKNRKSQTDNTEVIKIKETFNLQKEIKRIIG